MTVYRLTRILKPASVILAFLLSASLFICCGEKAFQTMPTHVTDFKGILIDDNASKKQARTVTTYMEQKGAVTLIVLSASWCPGCREELPLLKELAKDYGARGLKILMISEDDTPAAANKFRKKANIDWTMMHWNYDIMNILGNPGVIPVSFLVNAQDSIINAHVGVFDMRDMKSDIESLLRQ